MWHAARGIVAALEHHIITPSMPACTLLYTPHTTQDPAQPNNLAATLLNVRAGRCQPLPDGISPGCRAVISGLLCADPVKRTRLEVRACVCRARATAVEDCVLVAAGLGLGVLGARNYCLPCVPHTLQLDQTPTLTTTNNN